MGMKKGVFTAQDDMNLNTVRGNTRRPSFGHKLLSFIRLMLYSLMAILITFNVVIWAFSIYQVRIFQQDRMRLQRSLQRYILTQQQAKVQQEQAIALDTVAFVDGRPITLTQVRELAEEMPQLEEMSFETVYPNLLEMIINNQIVMQGAEKAGVLDRPEIKTQLRLAKEHIVGQTYLDELLSAHVTEEEMQDYYNQEIKNFRREEEIHAKHILLKTEKEAQDIIVQLKAGADFSELANSKSLDENTEGGDLGYFTKAMMIPEFGDAVFDMKKGQLSAPIKTPFGWHVVLVEDKRLANPPAFDEVRDDIMRTLMEAKLPEVLESERARMNVQVLRPRLVTENNQDLKPEN